MDSKDVLSFHGNGKLLLSAEYFVLDGAVALALPCKLGQSFIIQPNIEEKGKLQWTSYDEQQTIWFDAIFQLNETFSILETTHVEIANQLQKILSTCRSMNPSFLNTNEGIWASSSLDFPRSWGLGTSSTLIYALAKWANINPYTLLAATFGGSGYDIACAASPTPILYQYIQDGNPIVQHIAFKPACSKQLYFIYLGKKQDSRQGIKYYREKVLNKTVLIDTINDLTKAFLTSNTLDDFEKIILEHEDLIASNLNLPKAKELYFQDYWGQIKSLGAWGGDFVLATSERSFSETQTYFFQKGFHTVIPYNALIL